MNRGHVGGSTGQVPHGIEPIHEQGQRSGRLLAVGLDPALKRSQQGAGIEVTLTLLAVRCSVDDRTQGVRHRLGCRPRQADDFQPQSTSHMPQVSIVQGRVPCQQAVHQQPHHHDVAFSGCTLFLARQGVLAHAWLFRSQANGKAYQSRASCVVEQHVVQGKILVGHASVVCVCHAIEHVDDNGHHLQRAQVRLARRQPVRQRDARAPIVNREGPPFVHTHVDHRCQSGMLELGRQEHVLCPTLAFSGAHGLHSRHAQQHLGLQARIKGQPGVAGQAFADERLQLETAEASSWRSLDGRRRAHGGG